MANFCRILAYALRYRWTLLGILLTSGFAALLWGANLSTVYPIVDVVLQRQSMREWVDGQIATSKSTQAEIEVEIRRLQAAQESQGDDLSARLAVLQDSRSAEIRAQRQAERLKPWIVRYLPDAPFATLQVVVLALLAGTFLKSVFLVLNTILVERIAQKVVFDLRNELFERTLGMDLGYFGRERNTQLISFFTHDVEGVLAGLRTVFGRAILEPLKILACLGGAAWICWRLLVVSLLVTPLALLIINRLARLVKRASHRAMDEMAGLYHRLAESLQGIQVVKACDAEGYEVERFRAQGRQLLRGSRKIALFTALSKPGNELMSMSVVGFALLAGGYLVLNQETHVWGIQMSPRPLDFGGLMTFFALLAGVSDPSRKLVDVYNQIQHAAAAADRVAEMQERQSQLVESARPRELPVPLESIRFERVSFRYPDGPQVLHEVSLEIRAGETIAIVGPNGCGKSTLLNLLTRWYDPTSGAVTWNGVDLRDLKFSELRRRIGLVGQQAFLFDETVRENIRYGKREASDLEVEQAARRAFAHDFIVQKLPLAYDTRVGVGGKLLSGGQRQRITLARAILGQPSLLLLDEATSQVDVESERLIQGSLQNARRGRTTVLIAHRKETLRMADRVVVMEAGQIADVGTLEEVSLRSSFLLGLERAPGTGLVA